MSWPDATRTLRADNAPAVTCSGSASDPRACLFLGIAACLLVACSGHSPSPSQGYVEGEFVYVASSQGGRLERLSVTRGQPVALAAPLFGLETTDEAAAEQQAQRQLDASQAQLNDLQTGKRPPEVDVIRAQIAQAQAAATQAAAQIARDEVQYRAGGIAQLQLDQSRELAESSAARVRELQSDLAVALLPGREAQLRAQQAQVSAARAALAQARWKLDQKTIAAPRAGLVFDTIYREGEWVPAGAPVVQLLPPENIKVRFFVSETRLGALKLGQRASVSCDSCGAPIAATITYIATAAEYTPPVIYSNDTRDKLVYLIEAHPSASDAPRLHPGQPVQVSLE